MVHLSQWHVSMQCIHAITVWASSEDMHQPWDPCREHAPSEKANGDAAKSERHVPDDADDGSDHGASHSNQEAASAADKQGKRAREVLHQSQAAQVAGCHMSSRRLCL